MLDKNPNKILDNDFRQIKTNFSNQNPNFILSSKPFLKTEFLIRLIDSDSIPVIFLDLDLLYSGFVNSGITKKNEKVQIFRSSRISWENDLKEIIEKISRERVLVILDSLNGLYSIFDELESSRFLNAAIMLLSTVSRHTKSQIIATAMVIKNEAGEWILSPSGRHLLETKKSGVYHLGMSESSLILKTINKKKQDFKIFEINK